jgi:hypothetical protein
LDSVKGSVVKVLVYMESLLHHWQGHPAAAFSPASAGRPADPLGPSVVWRGSPPAHHAPWAGPARQIRPLRTARTRRARARDANPPGPPPPDSRRGRRRSARAPESECASPSFCHHRTSAIVARASSPPLPCSARKRPSAFLARSESRPGHSFSLRAPHARGDGRPTSTRARKQTRLCITSGGPRRA